MQQIVLVIHLLIALGLVGLVLIQRSEGGGLGMGGGGGGGGMMSVRGTASFLTRATGVLAAWCPRLRSSPWIRLYPYAEFSVAILTMSRLMAFMRPGRPVRRRASNVHFSAINRWCHRMIVSGVTIVATRLSA